MTSFLCFYKFRGPKIVLLEATFYLKVQDAKVSRKSLFYRQLFQSADNRTTGTIAARGAKQKPAKGPQQVKLGVGYLYCPRSRSINLRTNSVSGLQHALYVDNRNRPPRRICLQYAWLRKLLLLEYGRLDKEMRMGMIGY